MRNRILLSNSLLACLGILVLATNCTDSNFTGTGTSTKNGANANPRISPTPYPSNNPNGTPIGPGTLGGPGSSPLPSGAPGGIDGSGGNGGGNGNGLDSSGGQMCVKDNIDLNVMILMDTTGSMSSQYKDIAKGLPSLFAGLNNIKSSLGNRIQKFRMGFIGYIDQVRIENGIPLQMGPNEDINAATAFINQYAKSYGDHSDTAEGGGWAFLEAVKMFNTANPTGNAVNVVILATDAWSHDGSPCGNDCKAKGQRTFTPALYEAALQSANNKGLFIFDASPSDRNADGDNEFGDGTTSRYPSPAGQWEFLRQRSAQLRGLSAVGAHLGEEISNGGVGSMQQITTIIQNQIKLCP